MGAGLHFNKPFRQHYVSLDALSSTDKGALHKAVVVGTEAHIIEEIQLFEKPEAVQNLLLSPEKVGFLSCIGLGQHTFKGAYLIKKNTDIHLIATQREKQE